MIGSGVSQVSQRLEVALVRELEIAYASGSKPTVVLHASPYQWANACSDLLGDGRIDVLEHSIRYLHAIYPELTALATMVAWFNATPDDLPGLIDFRDDPAAEIQIVRREGCDAVLLCFCASQGTLGLPINLVHRWLGRLPVNLIYIKDFRDLSGACGYPSLGPDRASSVMALRRLADQFNVNHIYTLGVSLGGYAALHYGLELAAVGVLSLAGDTNLTAEFAELVEPSPAQPEILRNAPEYAKNLHDFYASSQHHPRLFLAFSARQSRDRQQAEQMLGLPNVRLVPVPDYLHHNVVDPLIRRGQFMNLLSWLLDVDMSSSLTLSSK